jgi:hypothetical protein
MEHVARPWLWLGIATVLGVIGAVVTSVWLHYPAATPPERVQDVVDRTARDAAESNSTAATPLSTNAQHVKLEELRAMSETFRNTTFLIAIRDSGYLCSELVSVYGGIGDSTTWTAACREMLAYTVRVSYAGALLVEPTAHHLDGIFPVERLEQAPPSPPPR